MRPVLTSGRGCAAAARSSKLQRAPVDGLRPHDRVEPRHRLEVVVEDVGARGEDGVERRARRRRSRARGPRPSPRAAPRAARAIVAANCPAPPSARSSRVTLVTTTWRRPSRRAASRHAPRLVGVERAETGSRRRPIAPAAPSLARLDRAEAAAPRADVAEDQERRRPRREALALVRAAGLVADGVQTQVVEHGAGRAERAGRRRLDPEPGRLAPAGALAAGDRGVTSAIAHRLCMPRPRPLKRGLADRLGERRMGVDRGRDVGQRQAGPRGERELVHELGHARADERRPEHACRRRARRRRARSRRSRPRSRPWSCR